MHPKPHWASILSIFAGAAAVAVPLAACTGSDFARERDPGDAAVVDAATSVDGGPAVSGDAAVDSSVVGDADAEAAAPPCDLSKPFDAPVPVGGVNTAANEEGAQLSPDELTIYFASDKAGGTGGLDLYVATRSSTASDFGSATPLGPLQSSSNDTWPSVTADGKTLVFSTWRPNNTIGSAEIYIATRASTAVPFGTPVALGPVNSLGFEGQPWLSPDGARLYFHRDTGQKEIVVATASAGVLSAPAALDLGPAANAPALTPDEKTIYVAALRSIPEAKGGEDIYVATRTAVSATFGPTSPVEALNSDADDYPTWASADGCRLYMMSNRQGGTGGYDLYVARRPK